MSNPANLFHDLTPNEVYTFVTVAGQEIIAKFNRFEQGIVYVVKPRVLTPQMVIDPRTGAQSMSVGLMPFTHTNREELFPTPIIATAIMSVVPPAPEAAKGYLSQTSGIALA